jgi:YHS domain-containing protein
MRNTPFPTGPRHVVHRAFTAPAEHRCVRELVARWRIRPEEVPTGSKEQAERFDVFSRFSERYLASAGGRSVYLALAAEPGRTWRAESLAREIGLTSAEVRAVIVLFEQAGIVETWTDDSGSRFAWRSDVRYLFGDRDEGDLPVDPVCGMRVDERSPYRSRDDRGDEPVFCSTACLEAFRATTRRTPGPAIPR